MGIRRETVSRALDQLECYGFVDITRGGLEHRPSEYKLVDKWVQLEDAEKMEEAKEAFKKRMGKKQKARECRTRFADTHAG